MVGLIETFWTNIVMKKRYWPFYGITRRLPHLTFLHSYFFSFSFFLDKISKIKKFRESFPFSISFLTLIVAWKIAKKRRFHVRKNCNHNFNVLINISNLEIISNFTIFHRMGYSCNLIKGRALVWSLTLKGNN